MIRQLIARYKRLRTERYLAQTFHAQYAFVGMGQHALTNLYPVLHYLGAPLKFTCVTSERKAHLIEHKFPHVTATTSLDNILADETVKGVFVSASPSAHFLIASRVLRSGKSLFIEKPPCLSEEELSQLIDLQTLHGSPVAMAGLQKRYAPAVQLLKKRLDKERLINYDLHYSTGAYPEGDALTELYIHPLDLVCHLFGKAEILACRQVAKDSYILMLQHTHVVGTLELSTAYSWAGAEESLKVCTTAGTYHLAQMEDLTFTPTPSSIIGIPTEKMYSHSMMHEHLYHRNSFVPTLPNNQIYSQGYFNEIAAFVHAVEGKRATIEGSLSSLSHPYHIIRNIIKTKTDP